MVTITEIELENFRSLSGTPNSLQVSHYNVIVGQNNSGKSNILRALNLFFNNQTDHGQFNPPVDFSLDPTLGPNSKTKITVTMRYTSVDVRIRSSVDRISDEIGIQPFGKNTIKLRLTISRKGTQTWQYIGSAGIRQIKEDYLQPLVDAIRSTVRFKYLPVGRDIDSVIQTELKRELVATIFSGWRAATQKKRINDSIAQLISSLQPELERTSGEISKTANKAFNELKQLSLELPFEDIDSLLPNLIPTANDGHMTPLRQKGSGIQTSSLLFYLKFLADNQPERKYSRPTYIWAIEEPESFLHPARQREMSEVLRDFSSEVQMFITTHSAQFIPKDKESKLFLVEKGTTPPFNTVVNSATTEEAKKSLGISILDAMVLAPLNIIVEGPSDEILLSEVLKILHKAGKIEFSPYDIKFFAAGNCTSACYLYESLTSYTEDEGIHTVLVIDGDEAGQKALRGLVERQKNKASHHLKSNENYFQLEKDIEWLIAPNIMEALKSAYPSKTTLVQDTSNQITHFAFNEGHKKDLAQKVIGLSGIGDLYDFEILLKKIIGSIPKPKS